MPISLVLTPFDHFHFRLALAVKCLPDLRVRHIQIFICIIFLIRIYSDIYSYRFLIQIYSREKSFQWSWFAAWLWWFRRVPNNRQRKSAKSSNPNCASQVQQLYIKRCSGEILCQVPGARLSACSRHRGNVVRRTRVGERRGHGFRSRRRRLICQTFSQSLNSTLFIVNNFYKCIKINGDSWVTL